MPDLLIVINDLWLICFFKLICVLNENIWIKLSKITASSSVPRKGQMYQYSKSRSAMQRFLQALHFYFSVVISNSFKCIFETVLLHDSINYSFLKIMLSASPALHQAPPIISLTTQINSWLRLTV